MRIQLNTHEGVAEETYHAKMKIKSHPRRIPKM